MFPSSLRLSGALAEDGLTSSRNTAHTVEPTLQRPQATPPVKRKSFPVSGVTPTSDLGAFRPTRSSTPLNVPFSEYVLVGDHKLITDRVPRVSRFEQPSRVRADAAAFVDIFREVQKLADECLIEILSDQRFVPVVRFDSLHSLTGGTDRHCIIHIVKHFELSAAAGCKRHERDIGARKHVSQILHKTH